MLILHVVVAQDVMRPFHYEKRLVTFIERQVRMIIPDEIRRIDINLKNTSIDRAPMISRWGQALASFSAFGTSPQHSVALLDAGRSY